MISAKVCGITNYKDAISSIENGAKALGFIFFPGSKRFIDENHAKKIIDDLPSSIFKVGVFVNQPKDQINAIKSFLNLNAIQLHGDEDANFCSNFDCFVIKAIRVANIMNFKLLKSYNVDAFLFDTFSKNSYGGTGKVFDWKLLEGFSGPPIILSGGLNPDNIQKAINCVKPQAVDVNSGIELHPGKKDKNKIEHFFSRLRSMNEKYYGQDLFDV